MDLVDPSRQGRIRLRDSLRPVVDRGSAHLEQFAVLLHRQPVRPIDNASALLGGYRPSLALNLGEWFLLVRFIFCSSSLWSFLQKTPLRNPLPVSSRRGPAQIRNSYPLLFYPFAICRGWGNETAWVGSQRGYTNRKPELTSGP
jgi:hypothetical protein